MRAQQQVFHSNLRKSAWGEPNVKRVTTPKEENPISIADPFIEQVILKKRKKRLPGESLVKKYALEEKNIKKSKMSYADPEATMQDGGCGDCQSGDGLVLAGAGVTLAGAGIRLAGAGMGHVHHALQTTLVGLAGSLTNSFFRGFKGKPRSQVTKAKYEISRQLVNAFMDIPVPEVKSHIKHYAEEIANAVITVLNLESSQAAEQVHKKVHQGLKRVFSKTMKGGGGQDGAGIFKSLRGLANRAAKGLQPLASRLFDQCAADPTACIGKARSVAGRVKSSIKSARSGDLSGVQGLISDGKEMLGEGSLSQGLKKLPGQVFKKVRGQASRFAKKCITNPIECAETLATGAAILL